VVFGGDATTIETSESRSFTGLPLNWTITSPGSMPALADGPPATTDDTSAPCRFLRPSVSSAFCG